LPQRDDFTTPDGVAPSVEMTATKPARSDLDIHPPPPHATFPGDALHTPDSELLVHLVRLVPKHIPFATCQLQGVVLGK